MAPEHIPSLRGRSTITTVIVVLALIGLCLVAWVYRNTPPLSNLLGSDQTSVETPDETSDEQNFDRYESSQFGFSILLPKDYAVDSAFQNQTLGPGLEINGVKFTISATMATGTNLSLDTYISVEQLPDATTCSASFFLDAPKNPDTVTENGVEYSVATGGGAGAGNLYEETVYAISGSVPCKAVRYMIHSTQLANYPAGTKTAYDRAALVAQFDQIRHSLILGR